MTGSYDCASPPIGPTSLGRATIAALCANLVGIGFARFAYTPLIPALIAAGWFAPGAAVYLGAANLAGYLVGALGAGRIAIHFGAAKALRMAVLLTATTLFACAFRLGFGWYFFWRFVSGCTGGVVMALAAPTAIAVVPAARRGLAGGVIFTGVGLGIAASGTLVPFLVQSGLVAAWLGLAAIAAILTASTWSWWPATALGAWFSPHRPPRPQSRALGGLYIEYALNAVGLVPHMLFLVDFVARGLGRGLAAGARDWIVFGAGAIIGPLVGGRVGDYIGFRRTLRLAFVAEAVAVAIPCWLTGRSAIALSSFVVGAFVPGIVAITIGRTRELLRDDPAAQIAAWSYCTTAFAAGQAVAAYGFSYLFARTDRAYPLLFGLGAAALSLALAIDLVAAAPVTLKRSI